MPKKDWTVLESEEELIDMIKNEKRGRFRDRLRLLWLLKSGDHGACRKTLQCLPSYRGEVVPPLRNIWNN